MANATAITVTSLASEAATALPTANAMDTGTSAVTLYTAAVDKGDRVIFVVNNTAAANLVATVLAGDNPPAFRAGLGALSSGNIAQNGTTILGPLDTARHIQNDGTIGVTFTPASGTIACNVICYKLAKT